ncbi:DUF1993 domain-containing protein [Parahaliea maris]|uniref:DUF1993 domain-containing protein n=1 Tax=Parahaliea maris TaxID=2716870 RepID=A0A5C9A1T6_9GAMM|nr:DUF1993 domain-containing protein [Parahaliea maris]TXS94009.1 DUF1993 domain-containing protein [Parahaliea maris]
MANLMYQGSAPVFTHHLKNLSAILKLAAKDAKTRGIAPEVLLNARLAPDMLPLAAQVMIATDHAKGCCARLAGQPSPVFADTESTFAELEARIRKTLAFIRTIKPAEYADSETRDITLTLPFGELYFKGADYLHGWVLPNFYFHYTTAYDILRHNGLAVGKREYLGVVPGMEMNAAAARAMGVKPQAAKKAVKKAARKKASK